MKFKSYLKNNNIVQVYSFEKVKELEYFHNLLEYTDLTKNTIFICKNDFDVNLINFHKGRKWIFIHKNCDLLKIKLIKTKVEEYLCDDNNISNKINKKCKNIKSEISNYNLINIINNKKVVFLILATKKYKKKYEKLLNYLKTFNYDYYIILSTDDKQKIEKPYIYLKIDDFWENLANKMIKALDIIYKNTVYSHVYKVDDNFFELNINLNNDIFNLDYYGNYIINNIKPDYHFGKCKNKKLNTLEYENLFIAPYAAGGYGYLLSRKAIFILLNNKDYIKNEIYEDKAIGDVLYTNNIKVNKNSYKDLNYNKPKEKKVEWKIKKNLLQKNKKLAVIFFHKNVYKLYKKEWIKKCIDSIINQSYKNFDIFEINYGNENYSVFNKSILDTFKNKYYFYKKNYQTHTEAMMYLLNKCFSSHNYDVVFNTNLDDYYLNNRFEKQLECINNGYDLCSSLMTYIKEENGTDKPMKKWTLDMLNLKSKNYYIETDLINVEINKNNNIINHSCVCFTKRFWLGYDKYNNLLRYRNDKPFEDLSLWKRAINNNFNITIINENLINYRIHSNQIGEQYKKDTKNINSDGEFKMKPSDDKKRIGIFCICTGNYVQYFKNLIDSIEKNFLVNYPKYYFISTDNKKEVTKICKIYNLNNLINVINKKGFPLDTLYRYQYLLDFDIEIELLCDVIYYIDVDMKVINKIGDEILPSKDKVLIGTQHPGYINENKNGTPEKNKKSTAYIDSKKFKNCYIAGGFNGGITNYFIKMAKEINSNILIDKSHNIISIWHDESHLNKYFLDNYNKFKILKANYCCPESNNENIKEQHKIIALDKPHTIIRNNTKQHKIIVNIRGGLGNILFQIFFGYTISMRYNLELCIINNQKNSREGVFYYRIFDNIFRISENNLLLNNDNHKIMEDTLSYVNYLDTIPTSTNVYVDGYFQSIKYFKNFYTRIIKKLDLSIQNIAKIILDNFRKVNKKHNIAVHLRGTDYLTSNNYHFNLDKKYYIDIIEQLDLPNINLILFTDDETYAVQHHGNIYTITIKTIINKHIPEKYKYLKNHPELHLFLLSHCETIICANSTFSLFGSYFSNADKIYIPRNWFGINGPKTFNVEDLCLNENYIIS